MKELVGAGGPSISGKELVGVEESGAEALVPRDQWDRPLILPREGHKDPCEPRTGRGGGCKCMIGYTRVSTLSESLSDPFGLHRYQKGNVLKGLVHRPAILNAAMVVRNKQDLYALVDLAEELGDDRGAAENGSMFHRVTEMWARGEDTSHLPDNVQAMLAAYAKEMTRHGFVATDTERFVVQDKVQAAGTFDTRIEGPDDAFIADTKTGQDLDHTALKVTMQVALYAAGAYYDIGTHERLPIGVNRDRGVLMWCPWVTDPKEAVCEARWLDLRNIGRPAVLEALKVREFRRLKPEQILPRIH